MAHIFRLSDAAVLGIHAMAFLTWESDRRASTKQIARVLAVSETHLAKVMQRLERAGLVQGKRGPAGGFEAPSNARTLSLRRIYEAIEGTQERVACLLKRPTCRTTCPLGSLVREYDQEILARLERTTLSDFTPQSGVPKMVQRARGKQ